MSNNALTFNQVKPFLKADLKAFKTPALLGEPGIGKSSLIEDLARDFKTAVFTLPVNQLADRSDLTGVRMTQDDKGNYRQEAFPHSIIMDAIQYATDHPDEAPILFLDEFNRASQDITSSILSFQTLRQIGTIKFPDNLRLIVAGNDSGNVTGVDKASVSRFSVYRVKPDLDTFLSVQQLNPFIQEVLNEHPDDLMADEYVYTSANQVDSDDDDDDDNEDIVGFEMLDSEDNFAQITCPRTITYTSEWLNAMGLNKSGSQDESNLLGSLFSDMSGEEVNPLLTAIEAHAGATTFSQHVFEKIRTYFHGMMNQTHVASQPALGHLRPDQSVINTLNRATGVQDIDTLIQNMSEDARTKTLVWLIEQASVKEVNNNQSVEYFMQNVPNQISDFKQGTQDLMRILSDSSRVSKKSIDALLSSNAPSLANWKPVIQMTVDHS